MEKVAKEAIERKSQMEILLLKNQLLNEKESKEAVEHSFTGEIDYLRQQLGLMRSVQTQLEEETNLKAALEISLQKAKEHLTEVKDRLSECQSTKVTKLFLASFF